MTEEVMTKESFEDRMKNRIREDIGKLMTDEELSKIVQRAMEEIFFAPRKVKQNYNTIEQPPFLHELLKELMEPLFRKAIDDYITKHREEVKQAIGEVLGKGAGMAVLSAIQSFLKQDFWSLENNINQRLQRLGE